MVDNIPVAGGKQPQNNAALNQSLEKAKELVKQARDMGFKVEETDEFKGVIKDLQAERERRQRLEDNDNNNRGQRQEPAPKQIDPNDLLNKINSLQDEDLVTGSQVKDLIGGLTGLVQQSLQNTTQMYMGDRAVNSETKAKEKYAEEKVGKDFAYDNVIKNYYGDIIKKLGTPGLHQQIMNSKDPSEAAYRLGLTHPDLLAKSEEITKVKVTQEIQENLRRVNKIGGAGGLINEIQAKQETRQTLLARSSEDIMAELRQDELGE